ncbi:ferrous iron transport protein B [Candidatus Aquicultor secundus]|uniref:ferrous iron transport protein B n=1 Tax=Candidatus Aquicultor secundus TaxID=1973895 RepID=UPI000A703A1F|nr:ferrous iron transport protein B [Candidatus Aquicultor secundus]
MEKDIGAVKTTHGGHCHTGALALDVPANCQKIVLVGNPNVGKSVFFNFFSGLYVDVSNYPGTTIEISQARYGDNAIIDTPGIYGVSSFNDEEIVARDIILSADKIVNVVDALHLERDLFLTLQLIDMGLPIVVALNFMDEARAQDIIIDSDLLSDLLGVSIIPTAAVKKQGLMDVEAALSEAREGHQDPFLHKRLHEMLSRVGSQPEALMVLEGDPYIAARHGVEPVDDREEIYVHRRERVNDIVGHVVHEVDLAESIRQKIGRLVLNPITGVPILAVILFGLYELVAVLVAQDIVGLTEGTIMKGYWEPFIRGIVSPVVSQSTPLGKILIGEFGILTMTITYLLGLLLPLVLGFYLALALMEDSGYLPRLATLVDRALNTIGLNGRAVVPIILGFGCVTMATITTRLLGTEREKTIATAILQWAIPCSAQIGVIAVLLGAIGGLYTLLYAAFIFLTLVTIGTVLSKWLPGKTSPLLIDLPPLRLPRPDNVVRKAVTRSFAFMKEATPWFFLGALIVSLMQVSGMLTAWQNVWEPITTGWLKLPKETATAFVMGLVRRDFGAAGLYAMHLTPMQTVVALVTITLFVPCVASVMILFKERGWKQAVPIWFGSWVLAFGLGGILAQILIRGL